MSKPRRVTRQSRFNLFLIMILMIVVMVICTTKTAKLYKESKSLDAEQETLVTAIADAEAEYEELQEREKYMHTMKYFEDEAKDKLNMVHEDEIVMKAKESE